jgi:hypothetical protein
MNLKCGFSNILLPPIGRRSRSADAYPATRGEKNPILKLSVATRARERVLATSVMASAGRSGEGGVPTMVVCRVSLFLALVMECVAFAMKLGFARW